VKYRSFGHYVTRARKQRGHSIRHFAARPGVAPSTISRLEEGSRSLPHADLALALIEHLDLDTATAIGLLEPYQRLVQASLPSLAEYLDITTR